MISAETIKKLAVKFQTSEENVYREYFQHLFLSALYSQKEADHMFFKGGTALRIIFKSPRFSEDLDFSLLSPEVFIVESLIADTLSQMEREGAEVDLEEAKRTTGGYLAKMYFNSAIGKILIKIEASFRRYKEGLRGELQTVFNDYTPSYNIFALEKNILVSEKIEALLGRRKARDFYDLYFLLRSSLIPIEKRNTLKQVSDILSKTEIYFEQELKEFLPKSHHLIVKDFKNILEREIERFGASGS